MSSFTGPELGALVAPGCIIGAHRVFSNELQRQISTSINTMRTLAMNLRYGHWMNGAYLITDVKEETSIIEMPLKDLRSLEFLIIHCKDTPDATSLCISMRGRNLRILRKGAFSGCGGSSKDMREELEKLKTPAKVVFAQEDDYGGNLDCGSDHVGAVNLTRCIDGPPNESGAKIVRGALALVHSKWPGTKKVQVTHYLGGPCNDSEISQCLVFGGKGRGWTLLQNLSNAVLLAHRRALPGGIGGPAIGGGQSVRLKELQSEAGKVLNGQLGLALRWVDKKGRWVVRLCNGKGIKIKPVNLEPLEGQHGRVYVFWGNAGWSRTQLLGEIARGHWGLAKASVGDLITKVGERRKGLDGRLAFAPETAMTEGFMKAAQQKMQAVRASARRAVADAQAEEDD